MAVAVPQPAALVRQAVATALRRAFPTHGAAPAIRFEPERGAYCASNALALARGAGLAAPEAAELLCAALPETGGALLPAARGARPGFVELRLSPAYVGAGVRAVAALALAPEPRLVAAAGAPTRVLVDFSSPNVAKELHVGHLRSTIIGDSIARVLEARGHDVLRRNHVGDWGTQFGMLVAHVAERFPDAASDPPPLEALTTLYQEARARFDGDPAFKAESQRRVTLLQSGDEPSLALWRALCALSRREFEALYARLGVRIEEVGESSFNHLLPAMCDELATAGHASVGEGGALLLHVDGIKVPLMVRKSDGGFGYDSTDLAAVRDRTQREGARRVIYVTDVGQKQHFDLLFGAARAAGYVDDAVQLDHVGFGLVLGSGGKRMQTRSGDVPRLEELIDEAAQRALLELQERDQASAGTEQQRLLAEAVGVACVKYADLRMKRSSDYTFSFDKMLDARGDTGVYQLYAYARLCRLLDKASAGRAQSLESLLADPAELSFTEPSEIALATHLLQFSEAVEHVEANLSPHTLAGFCSRLATLSSSFYENCRVVGGENDAFLCEPLRSLGFSPH